MPSFVFRKSLVHKCSFSVYEREKYCLVLLFLWSNKYCFPTQTRGFNNRNYGTGGWCMERTQISERGRRERASSPIPRLCCDVQESSQFLSESLCRDLAFPALQDDCTSNIKAYGLYVWSLIAQCWQREHQIPYKFHSDSYRRTTYKYCCFAHEIPAGETRNRTIKYCPLTWALI